jgi:hypothetical protein
VTIEEKGGTRAVSEELEVAGSQAADKVRELIRQGNVRKVVIRSADGKVLLETSPTIASGIGIVPFLLNLPWAVLVAAVAAIGAAMFRVKVEIVREVSDNGPTVVEGRKAASCRVDIEGVIRCRAWRHVPPQFSRSTEDDPLPVRLLGFTDLEIGAASSVRS